MPTEMRRRQSVAIVTWLRSANHRMPWYRSTITVILGRKPRPPFDYLRARVCRAIRTRSFASVAVRVFSAQAFLPCRCALAGEALGGETGSGNRLLLHRFCISPRVFWTALRYVALPCSWRCELKASFAVEPITSNWLHSLASYRSYPEVSYGKSLITPWFY